MESIEGVLDCVIPQLKPLEGGAVLALAVSTQRPSGRGIAQEAGVETSWTTVGVTGDANACEKREALPAERRGGSEQGGNTGSTGCSTGKALAAKNRVITIASRWRETTWA